MHKGRLSSVALGEFMVLERSALSYSYCIRFLESSLYHTLLLKQCTPFEYLLLYGPHSHFHLYQWLSQGLRNLLFFLVCHRSGVLCTSDVFDFLFKCP